MVSDESTQEKIKEKLKSRIFIGKYSEKLLIPELNDYRNRIILSASETELMHDLTKLKKKYHLFSTGFFGFNDGSLYVEDDSLEETAFGFYWFQIKTIKFKDTEVKYKLKVLRKVEESDFNVTTGSESSFNSTGKSSNQTEDIELIEWRDIFANWLDSTSKIIKEFLYLKVNRENIQKLFHITGLIAVAAAVAALHCVQYIGNFTLRFMTEFSKLIQVCTPLFFGVLDLFSRIIGGLFIFLTMLWKDSIGGGRQVSRALPAGPQMAQIQYRPVNQNNRRSYSWKQTT